MLRSNFIKRINDVIFAGTACLLLSPILLLVALIIIIDNGFPVFYLSERVGMNGKPFTIYKFRSMVRNADSIGPAVSTESDPRITRSGSFLRASKLDELPQLINIIRGDMSIIGPRPEVPGYVSYYTEGQLKTLNVRPGLSSPGALYYYFIDMPEDGADFESLYLNHILPTKLAYDTKYIERFLKFGIIEDFKLIIITVIAIFLFVAQKILPFKWKYVKKNLKIYS